MCGALRGEASPIRWSVQYRYQQETWGDETKSERGITLAAGTTLATGTYLSGSLAWASHRGAEPRDVLRLRTGMATPLAWGTLAATATTEHDLTLGRVATALVGAGWSGPLTDATALDLEVEHDLTGARTTRLAAGLTHDLPNGAQASVDVDARSGPGAPTRVTAELGVSVPLELRLGRRAGVTEVRGALLDADGSGLPGLLISLAGFTTLTAADGSFHFPGIPAGEYVLFVGGLPAGTVTGPALPLRVSVPVAAPLVINAQRGATVRGTVHVRQPAIGASEAGVVEGATVAAVGTVHAAGLRVVFTGEAGRREAITDLRGEFELNDLMPGHWRVEVDPASLPDGYQLTQPIIELRLRPGQVAEVAFEATPVRRVIRFTGGGALGD